MKGPKDMKAAICLCLLMSGVLPAQVARREVVYAGAVNLADQIVPLLQNGHLIYLHRPNRLQVFRPNTQLAYEYDVPCPPRTSNCSVGGVAVTRKGVVALGIAYLTTGGYASGIRFLDDAGKETRFVETGLYVPVQLAFDKNENLWSMGWERDRWVNDRESNEPYNVVHKYSVDGKLLGEHLPTSLWATKYRPDLGGRGYWTMCAADDRLGAIFNENFFERTPEWIEWDVNGAVLQRTPLVESQKIYSRAFASNGRLYAQFPIKDQKVRTDLRVLESGTGKWIPVRANLPDQVVAFLLGADGNELVYRVHGGGNVPN